MNVPLGLLLECVVGAVERLQAFPYGKSCGVGVIPPRMHRGSLEHKQVRQIQRPSMCVRLGGRWAAHLQEHDIDGFKRAAVRTG